MSGELMPWEKYAAQAVPAEDGPWTKYQAKPDGGMLSAVDNVIRQVAKGATFGFADEIAAAGNAAFGGITGAPGTFGGRYDAALAAERAKDKDYEARNPVSSTAMQVAGSLANPISRIAPGGSLPWRVAGNAAVGAGIGAVAGFGEGEGGFSNRMGPAITGAATGGVLGAGIPLVAAGVAKGARGVGGWLGLNNAKTDAQRQLIRALQADAVAGGDDLPAVAAKLKGAPPDQPMILPDVAGEATMGLAQQVSREPGVGRATARATVNERGGLNQSTRLADAVRRGISADDFLATQQELLNTRASAARPLYEDAFTKITPTAQEAAKVQRFISDPIGQEALQKGMRVIELEHLAAGTKFNPADYGVVRAGTEIPAAAGGVPPGFSPGLATVGGSPSSRAATKVEGKPGTWVLEGGKVPNLRLMDAVKRGYDEIVEGFRNEYGKLQLDQYGRAVNNARAVYRDTLADTFPTYGAALKAWSGPSQALDAMNLGRRVLSGDVDQTAQAIAKMTPGEKDMFRIGAARALIDKVRGTGDTKDLTKINNVWGSDAIRDRVAAAFDSPKSFEEFSDFMKREMDMARTNRVIDPRAGSQTAPLLAQRAQPAPAGPMLSALVSSLRGDALGTGASVLRASGALQPGVTLRAEELAPYLFTMKPSDRARLIDELMARETTDAGRERIGRALSGALLKGGTVAGVQMENN